MYRHILEQEWVDMQYLQFIQNHWLKKGHANINKKEDREVPSVRKIYLVLNNTPTKHLLSHDILMDCLRAT